jgi:hypothetical protein
MKLKLATRTFAIAAALVCTLTAHAQTAPKKVDAGPAPDGLLWVGNSFFYYNNSMHGHFARMVSAAQGRVRQTSATLSGAGLDWHDLNALLNNDAMGGYSFVGENEVRFNKPGKRYDTVIMMDCSQCPVHPQLAPIFHDTVRKNAQIAVKAGARPVLFMSWAYKDKPEMTEQLAEQYTLAANNNDALVVPAGLAFARAMKARPDVELYEPDNRHPTLAGTYLGTATTYAVLYGKSPVGLAYTAGLNADVAKYLQTVAWETVQAYTKR